MENFNILYLELCILYQKSLLWRFCMILLRSYFMLVYHRVLFMASKRSWCIRYKFWHINTFGLPLYFLIVSTLHIQWYRPCTLSKTMPMLSSSGNRYSRTTTDCFGLWIVAFNGTCIRNCPNLHPGRFLLLLRQEVDDKFSERASYHNMLLSTFWLSFFFLCCSLVGGQLVLRLPSGVV